MYVPKWLLVAVELLVAVVFGWVLHLSITGTAAGAAEEAGRESSSVNGSTGAGGETGSDTAHPAPVYVVVSGDAARSLQQAAAPDPSSPPGSAGSTAPEGSGARSRAPARAPSGTVNSGNSTAASSQLHAPQVVEGISIIANGDRIVIANDGSIVAAGDNPVVRGNTGDAAASGAIAVDTQGSDIATGTSTTTRRSELGTSPSTGLDAASAAGSGAPGGTAAPADGAAAPAGLAQRAVAISGWEDHSLEVLGDDNVLTYDDSNVMLNRRGTLNGNTGDTDTSGLNVVDATGSVVRTGASGNSDESPDATFGNPTGGSTGQRAVPGGWSASVADVSGVATANGVDSLVIGGDGVDDNGVRIVGNRNVATYDDGNVAIGGAGDVNAQIGDSDTSGAVVMSVNGSWIESGSSFLPWYQQAGAQYADPFDGDDPDVEADSPW